MSIETAQTKVQVFDRRLLYVAVFVGGMTTLAVELSASRLLGNVFGTGNLVWANVIGLMLLYLTIGYYVGGRWADHSPHYSTLYSIMIWAAFLSALIPLVSRPVLQAAAQAVVGVDAGLALGSFISILVLFSVPVTLMGCISPFAIRLAIDDPSQAGKISGQIYAISTLGSLLGTFLPTLFLIPELGTTRTFLVFSGILFSIAFIGLWVYARSRAIRLLWMPVLIVILSIWSLNGFLRPPQADQIVLYDEESTYNYIQVVENADGFRELLLNEGLGVHSKYHPDIYAYGETWQLFLAAPYFNAPPHPAINVDSLLVIGLAAGTIPRQHIRVYGDIAVDGVEIDPKIVDAASQYFDMNAEEMPSLTVYVEDGRFVLNQLNAQYAVVALDAYRPPYIPWHLTTVEFFREVRDRMEPDGVVAINVGRTSTDLRLVEAMAQTLGLVFPSVHAVDVPRAFNTILVATMQPTSPENLVENLRLLQQTPGTSPILLDALQIAIDNPRSLSSSEIIFTDDRAPVETLVDSQILNFLLYGNLDEIR